MNKFKNFCKKPLMMISICFMAVFFVAVVVLICIPHGKVYVYNYQLEGVEYKYQIVLDDKYELTHVEYFNGKTYNVGDIDTKKYDYEVENGILYLYDGGTANEKHEIAKIDSRKITLEYNILGEEGNTVLTCKINSVLTRVFVVGLYLSLAVFIASIVVICVDKKNKPKEDVVESNEQLDEQPNENSEEKFEVEEQKGTEVEVVEVTEKE